jgi:hypothetical protein
MRYLVTFIILLHGAVGVGQVRKPKQAPPPPPSLSDTLSEAFFRPQITLYEAEKRRWFYPWRKAHQVMLVTFDERVNSQPVPHPDDSIRAPAPEVGGRSLSLTVLGDSLDFSALAHAVVLSASQVDSLTDILYNSCERWTYRQSTRFGCYEPRHAIVFLDKRKHIVAYIEISLYCHQLRYSNKRIKRLDDCDYVFEELKKYLNVLGAQP